ncbi:hypothetical protein FKW77_007097 [Venturia effusa]|uniref:Uncharacterized protein n=1 Tax=Venturia effusa TaxID=50376 RepID=A0A517L7K8_9PEZI|nr:hypothetical protein FKW77_007097 [Venturia effusa]
MMLLDLPPEILQAILINSVRLRGLKRGVRLRLVNKFLSQEVIWAVSKSGLLEDHCNYPYRGSPPGDYLLPKALENRDDEQGRYTLQILRHLADKLCSLNNKSEDLETWKKYMVEMSSLVADANPCFTTVSPTGRQNIVENTSPMAMDAHLQAAAAHLNMVSIVEQLITTGVWHDRPTFLMTNSSLLGSPQTLAAKAGNSEILALLTKEAFAPTAKVLWNHHRGLLATASAAGHMEAVRVLLQRKRDPACNYADFRGYLIRALSTPSLEVYELIRTAIHELDGTPMQKRYKKVFGTNEFFEAMFKTCVWEGWTSMAVYFLDLGATVNSCRENGITAAFVNNSSLAHACRTGNISMVRMLLNRGLDTTYALSYAAAGGNLSLVKLLLDHGCDPNEGYPPPLAWAVDLEHEAMFNLLHDRGARMTLPSARHDIVARARGAGLESMLSLISNKEGIDPYDSTYTTPAPRPRKLCFMCQPDDEDGSD